MRIFGDPSDATFDEDDFVFLGMLPIPFDRAFTGITVGPFRIAARDLHMSGAAATGLHMLGGAAAEIHKAGA